MGTKLSNLGRHSAVRWGVYARWLYIMTAFAFLPVIARGINNTLPWIGELDVTYADAFGLFGMMVAGAYFGVYYGKHGTTWKGWYWGVTAPTLAIFGIVLMSVIVLGVDCRWPCGEDAGLMVASARDVAVGVAGAVLGANIGWMYHTGKVSKIRRVMREGGPLLAIFVGALVVVYAQDTGNNAMLLGIVPFMDAVAVVAGAALGAYYGSSKTRCRDRPRSAKVTTFILGLLIAAHFLTDLHVVPPYELVWMLALPSLSTLIGMVGSTLGVHVSARM